jgi:DNA-binding winged helix-turn-helix (wHTH) protein
MHFIVDSDTRQLLSKGTEVHLSPKAFDLLCALLTRRPNVVAKEDLQQLIWPRSYVVEANLNVLIGEVRRAIGDNPHTPLCIRTVHGVGYAFCGNATEEDRVNQSRYRIVAKERDFMLLEGDNIIGRDPSCHIRLDDPDVSRRHARIRIESITNSALLEDLESTNGTMVGRFRVVSQTPLVDGDLIRIGPIQLKFRDTSDASQKTRRIRRK